jgi:hypothetical protein
MLGHDEKFRHFLLRRVRPLRLDTMRKYEEKVSCCAEIVQHWENVAEQPEARTRVVSEKVRLRSLLISVHNDACRMIGDCADEYTWLEELWLARRRFALTSGNFFQFSLRPGKLRRFLSAWCYYRWVQFKTFGKRLPKQPGRWIDRRQGYSSNHKETIKTAF